MSRAAAVAEALSELPLSSTAELPTLLTDPNRQAPQAPPGLARLSPRERELVSLVAWALGASLFERLRETLVEAA